MFTVYSIRTHFLQEMHFLVTGCSCQQYNLFTAVTTSEIAMDSKKLLLKPLPSAYFITYPIRQCRFQPVQRCMRHDLIHSHHRARAGPGTPSLHIGPPWESFGVICIYYLLLLYICLFTHWEYPSIQSEIQVNKFRVELMLYVFYPLNGTNFR